MSYKVIDEYTPLSPWQYFGYQLLFSIPIVGFIFLVVFALGGANNINLKNFARSYFCIYVVIFFICLIAVMFLGLIALTDLLIK